MNNKLGGKKPNTANNITHLDILVNRDIVLYFKPGKTLADVEYTIENDNYCFKHHNVTIRGMYVKQNRQSVRLRFWSIV